MPKCLETRQRDGMKFRRYRTDDGRTYTTYEIPAPVLRAFPMARIRKRLEQFQSGEAHREKRAALKRAIARYTAEGWKAAAIANELGVNDRYVQRIRRELSVKK